MKRKISENQKLEIRNLISFRGKIKQNEIPLLIMRMKECVQKQKGSVIGNPISATFGVERVSNEKIADVEVMLPIDSKIDTCEEFFWKPQIVINHAVKLKYVGHPIGLGDVFYNKFCSRRNDLLFVPWVLPISITSEK